MPTQIIDYFSIDTFSRYASFVVTDFPPPPKSIVAVLFDWMESKKKKMKFFQLKNIRDSGKNFFRLNKFIPNTNLNNSNNWFVSFNFEDYTVRPNFWKLIFFLARIKFTPKFVFFKKKSWTYFEYQLHSLFRLILIYLFIYCSTTAKTLPMKAVKFIDFDFIFSRFPGILEEYECIYLDAERFQCKSLIDI